MPSPSSSSQALAHDLIPLPPEWSPSLLRHLETTLLPRYLPTCRWFGGKRRQIQTLQLTRSVSSGIASGRYFNLGVHYAGGGSEVYVLPLAILKAMPGPPPEGPPPLVLAAFDSGHLLVDAYTLADFRSELLTFFHTADNRPKAELRAKIFRETEMAASAPTQLLGVEQSHTSVTIGDHLWLKLYRRFENGIHPEEEVMRFLQMSDTFTALPVLYGALELAGSNDPGLVGLLMERVANDGDGWKYTLTLLSQYFQNALEAGTPARDAQSLGQIRDECSSHLAVPLGSLTAQLHLALAAGTPDHPHFAPEPLTSLDQRALSQRLRANAETIIGTLEQSTSSLPASVRDMVMPLLSRRHELFAFYNRLSREEMGGRKIRVHGDLHLAQVLYRPPQFIFIDFEGPPAASLADRRTKRSALVDVASMLRSFDFASAMALRLQPPEIQPGLAPHARAWSEEMSQSFLNAYFKGAHNADFLPKDTGHRQLLLRALLLDKALYELEYELSYRPDWATIPLAAVLRLLSEV